MHRSEARVHPTRASALLLCYRRDLRPLPNRWSLVRTTHHPLRDMTVELRMLRFLQSCPPYGCTTILTFWVTGSPSDVPETVTTWIPERLNLWVIAEYGR
jgi:hypothetical protein